LVRYKLRVSPKGQKEPRVTPSENESDVGKSYIKKEDSSGACQETGLKPGQPSAKSKLTYEAQEKIIGAVRGGQTLECAAALAHIDRSTLNDWRYRGQQEAAGSRYAEFNQAMEWALLESEAMLVHAIVTDSDWKAKKWILKNRFPDRYRDLTRAELAGLDGKAIPVDMGARFTVVVNCPECEAAVSDAENPYKMRAAAESNGQ
jgi:hypothetical protein